MTLKSSVANTCVPEHVLSQYKLRSYNIDKPISCSPVNSDVGDKRSSEVLFATSTERELNNLVSNLLYLKCGGLLFAIIIQIYRNVFTRALQICI